MREWVEIAEQTWALHVPGGVLIRYDAWAENTNSREGEYPQKLVGSALTFVPMVRVAESGDGRYGLKPVNS